VASMAISIWADPIDEAEGFHSAHAQLGVGEDAERCSKDPEGTASSNAETDPTRS